MFGEGKKIEFNYNPKFTEKQELKSIIGASVTAKHQPTAPKAIPGFIQIGLLW